MEPCWGSVAVRLAVVVAATAVVETAKLAVVEPPPTVTLEGTETAL